MKQIVRGCMVYSMYNSTESAEGKLHNFLNNLM